MTAPRRPTKGFTLIELLVVIAIVAMLSAAVIVSLNPPELLRQARDASRISDLAALENALLLYRSDVAAPNLGASLRCYTTFATTTCEGFFPSATSQTNSASRAIDGTGWVPVDLTKIGAGSPITQLPIDPINDGTHFYAYISSSTTLTFKLAARMESVKYASSGPADITSTDGGPNTTTSVITYEVGSGLGL